MVGRCAFDCTDCLLTAIAQTSAILAPTARRRVSASSTPRSQAGYHASIFKTSCKHNSLCAYDQAVVMDAGFGEILTVLYASFYSSARHANSAPGRSLA